MIIYTQTERNARNERNVVNMKKFAVNGKAVSGKEVFKVLAIKNSFATFENVKTGDLFRRAVFHTKDTEWCVVDTEYFSGKILPM